MDNKALFKIQCGLYIAGVELGGKVNGCISNTLMQQAHAPVTISATLGKSNLTHEMLMEKRSLSASILSDKVSVDLIRRFGFASGRDKDKLADIDYETDANGNPYLMTDEVAAVLCLEVTGTVDVGTHTIFLCTPIDMIDREGGAITYTGYQTSLKKK